MPSRLATPVSHAFDATPHLFTFSGAWPHRRLLIALSTFAAVSAVAGGGALLAWPRGNSVTPLALLQGSPFESFLVPGLLLTFVVGGSNAACAILNWRRSPFAVDAAWLSGGALGVWIVAELAMMRALHPLHVIYGTLGFAILGLAGDAARRSNQPRHRWVFTVTAAEALGFLAPATVGFATTRAGIDGAPQVALVSAAGLVEGLALGIGQAWAFPFRVRRLRYAWLSSLGAGLVWAVVMTLTMLASMPSVPVAADVVAGVLTGAAGLGAIGGAQWLELRRHVMNARGWIGWTALAWTLALPFSFAPAPFVDEHTPVGWSAILWVCGGAVMAYVMALVTWQGVRRLRFGNP